MRAARALLLRLVLALGLVFSPLSQPLALASLAAPAPADGQGGCPHHAATADAEQPVPGECCYMKGAGCHCAMAVALPTMPMTMLAEAVSDHPVSAPVLAASSLPPPEPPPPRT